MDKCQSCGQPANHYHPRIRALLCSECEAKMPHIQINNDNPIEHLWNSTADFHRRFKKYPPVPSECLKVFGEESREFAEEVRHHVMGHGNLENMAAEAADVLVTMLGAMMASGVSVNDFLAAVHVVAAKNNAKTWETHFLREDGKIAKRVKNG